MPGQTGPDSESSLGRGSQAPSETSEMNGLSHQPPSQEECQAQSGEVSSGMDARSKPPVASPCGSPSRSSMSFPTTVSSEEAIPSRSLDEAPPLSPSAPPPSLSEDSSRTEEQGHASVTLERAKCHTQSPVTDSEHTERKGLASPCNSGADACDEADTETPLVSGPLEQREAQIFITPGDSKEGVSSEQTNLENPFLGSSEETEVKVIFPSSPGEDMSGDISERCPLLTVGANDSQSMNFHHTSATSDDAWDVGLHPGPDV